MMCACMYSVYVYTWICMQMVGCTCGYAGIYRCMCVFVSAVIYACECTCVHVKVGVLSLCT